jgi:glycosyltransferase involved in cell wall biosynthesis
VNLHIPPLIPGLFLPKHIPLILTAHTTYTGMSGKFYHKAYFTSQWNNIEIAFKRWMELRIFKQAAKIIALTEQGKQELISYEIDSPIVIIPNGADLVAFKPKLNAEKIYDVLFCGRIEHRKGSRAMVEVCKNLIQQKSDIRIVIVGYGDDDAWVKHQLAPYSQNVQLTGKVVFTDMQAYYQASRLYVSTSYYEGLPGTCLEATAMGLPTIAWDFLFYHGLVVPDKTGYLIEPNDYLAMSQKIVAVLDDKQNYARLAANTRAHVEAHYNWSDLSKQILHVFKH